jgi:GAF domain-containing protein
MSEHLVVAGQTKAERYASLLPQIKALIEGESNLVANLANIAAALHEAFGFWWVGFYLVEGDELVLGPFQGPVACTRIGRGRGVCGTAWQKGQTIVVEDVEQFPGHIACSSASRSEIVVPMWKGNKVWGVLDIDSEKLATFDECDQEWLEKLCQMI